MSDGDAPKALDTDRLCELTRASADASSHAFAQFSGLPLRVSETSAISAEAPLEPGRWPKGIFFDIEGKLEGQIGILPGAGGTQRLPRLIGPKAALDLIVSGRHVPAQRSGHDVQLDEPDLVVDEIARVWRASRR